MKYSPSFWQLCDTFLCAYARFIMESQTCHAHTLKMSISSLDAASIIEYLLIKWLVVANQNMALAMHLKFLFHRSFNFFLFADQRTNLCDIFLSKHYFRNICLFSLPHISSALKTSEQVPFDELMRAQVNFIIYINIFLRCKIRNSHSYFWFCAKIAKRSWPWGKSAWKYHGKGKW